MKRKSQIELINVATEIDIGIGIAIGIKIHIKIDINAMGQNLEPNIREAIDRSM